ncbi:MAG: GNAT family N-acetyltransferase [Rickettsiella sp.]|nr:GNAT family N-acetyltransferase [Rickettsiella sp.]
MKKSHQSKEQTIPEINFVSLFLRSDLKSPANEFIHDLWPAFMMHSKVSMDNWSKIISGDLAKYHIVALKNNGVSGETIVGVASAVPLPGVEIDQAAAMLPDEGWDEAVLRSVNYFNNLDQAKKNDMDPSIICALSVTVSPNYRSTGLAAKLIAELCQISKKARFKAMAVPLRPTKRTQYPLQSFEEYCSWQREDGLPFDPWIRTHVKLGAKIVKVAARSMVIDGSLFEWQDWTNLRFLKSGQYWIPGGLAPLVVDVEQSRARYAEPNLWIIHKLH